MQRGRDQALYGCMDNVSVYFLEQLAEKGGTRYKSTTSRDRTQDQPAEESGIRPLGHLAGLMYRFSSSLSQGP